MASGQTHSYIQSKEVNFNHTNAKIHLKNEQCVISEKKLINKSVKNEIERAIYTIIFHRKLILYSSLKNKLITQTHNTQSSSINM